AQAVQEDAPLLARAARPGFILCRELVEQSFLRIDANGATVVTLRRGSDPIDDMQEFQRRIHATCGPRGIISHMICKCGLVHACQHLVLVLRAALHFSAPSTGRRPRPCRGPRSDRPWW